MARLASSHRPPILASLCLAAGAILLGPPPPVAVEAMGPAPACIVQGERHGEIIVPMGPWNTPVVKPDGHWNMPIFGYEGPPLIDVDRLVSGLKRMFDTPRT